MLAKFSSLEHTGVILLNFKPTIRLIGLYRPPENLCAQDFIDDLRHY